MGDFQAIAKQFCDFYYSTFDGDRAQLVNLYRDTSMLTFEEQPTQGAAAIVQKLQSLPLQNVVHRVDKMDAQPSNASGGILVVITGHLEVDRDRPMSYTQTFQLIPEGSTYYVFNDIFRLVYPGS